MADQVAALDHISGGRFSGTLLLGGWSKITPPNMPSIDLTIAYKPVEDGWTQARIVELPAVITAGPTRAEAKELVLDALREYLLSLQTEPTAEDGEREPLALTIAA